MARSSEGILIGFPQQENAGDIALRATNATADRVTNLFQQRQENARADERQSWARQLQPYSVQRAADEQAARQMQLDEAEAQVKRDAAAKEEWGKLAARFGTDNEPTGEEIMIAHANMAVARRDGAGASSAINTLAQMKLGDERGKELEDLVVKTAPMLGTLHTPEGLANLSKALDGHPKAMSTPTYQELWKHLLKGYEKAYPPEAAEAMQEYRILKSQGEDPGVAWNKALSTRPDASRYFGQKGNMPPDVQDELKQGDVQKRQSQIVKEREAEKRQTGFETAAAKGKAAAELEKSKQAARLELAKLNAQLRTHGASNDLKAAWTVTNQALGRVNAEIKNLTKQLTAPGTSEDDIAVIQGKLDIQTGLQQTLQDTLGRISDATTQKAGVPAAPAAAPTSEAAADKALAPHAKAIAAAMDRAQKVQGAKFNRDAELRKAINALVKAGTVTKDQGIALYRQQSTGQ